MNTKPTLYHSTKTVHQTMISQTNYFQYQRIQFIWLFFEHNRKFLKHAHKDLNNIMASFVQYSESLSTLVNKTRSYSSMIDDLQKKNASSFQICVAVLYNFLCGNQNSPILTMILENPNLKNTAIKSDSKTVERAEENKRVKRQSNLNEFCEEKFKIFEKDTTLQYIWWMLKPFMRGKLLYAPTTPTTDRIMARFQKAFNSWKDDAKIFVNQIIPAILQMLNHSTFQNSQKFTSSAFGKLVSRNIGANTMNSFLSDFEKGSLLINKLNTLKDAPFNMSDILECFEFNKVVGYIDENSALVPAMELLENNSLLAMIVFINPGNETLNSNVTYKIRMDEQRVDDTSYIQDSLWNQKPRYSPYWDEKYIKFGFAYIQDILDNYIIEELTLKTNIPGIILQEFPFPCYVNDSFNDQISFMFPLIMVLSWSFTCAMIIKSIVHEKEKRLKETMKMMGLGNTIHWCGWFIDSFMPMFVTICLLTVILKYGNILTGVSFSLLMVFLILYATSTITLAFLISTFFNRANLAAAAGGVIFFALYIPYPILEKWTSYFSTLQKCLISLSSNSAFGVGSSYFSQYAQRGIGISWQNIFESPVNGDNFNLAYIMIMLIIDIIIYISCTLYIEAVFPGHYGIPKPWYFPFIRYSSKKWKDNADEILFRSTPLSNYESEPTHLKLGVKIKELGLVYSNGKVAVNGLSLNFYEDQITSLLGHNGAGKTSTISVLTGLYPPSHGSVVINGQNFHSSMETVYSNLGICPQHNIIFDLLSVEEHLWFYSQLRFQNGSEALEEIETMIQNTGLFTNRTTLAMKLSGGMQRKLSVAAAFIGGPKTVILDEPTSSIDPYSRRAIWDLLIKYKEGRTIILTTHSMDEADMLSDRIAIMVNGQIECCGTTLFLKDQFGSGFRLALEMKNKYQLQENVNDYESNIKDLARLVMEIIPSGKLIEQSDTSLLFTLPNRNDTNTLKKLFSELEKKKDLFGISSYNISDTSLEEIFLRVTEKTESMNSRNSDLEEDNLLKEEEKITSNKNWNHFCALWVKRYHHTKRNIKALFSELILPSLFVYLAVFATSMEPPTTPRPSLSINPWIYNKPRFMFYNNNATNVTLWQNIMEEIFGSVGLGTRCVTYNRDKSCVTSSTRNESWYKHPAPNISEFGPKCSCDTGAAVCPEKDSFTMPPSTLLVAGDTMFDLTSSNVSDFLVKTYNQFDSSLFGGYTLGVLSPIPQSYNYSGVFNALSILQAGLTGNSDINYSLQENTSTLHVKVWYNNKAWVSSVAYMNAIKNVLLRTFLSSKNTSSYGIDAYNHPMPYTQKQIVLFKMDKEQVAIFHAIALLFALSFVPASFTAYLVEERALGSKHLQLSSGLNKSIYWLHVTIWDLVCYWLSSTFCIFAFLLLQEQAYVSSENIFGLTCLLYMYGFACIPMMYPLSLKFSVPSTAFVVTACANMFVSVSTMTLTILLEKFSDAELSKISNFLEMIFIVFPHFALGNGIKKLASSYLIGMYSSVIGNGYSPQDNIFTWNLLGKNLCFMAIMGCIFYLLTFLLEYDVFNKLLDIKTKKVYFFPPEDIDEDVLSERDRIESGDVKEDVLVIKDLCKVYRKNGSLHPVVNHLTLGIKKGECFGLLGLNGAGKTVTLKMLSGRIQSTWGESVINDVNVSTDSERVRSLIGYCPQFDALDNLLTPKEHLEFYARIRNISSVKIKTIVSQSLESFGLVPYKDCIAGVLSGGNKRKLSNAIAVMGNPPLLLLDEPTSGMDPKSRKFLKSRIKSLVQKGHSVILTSHSMEECQELCTRLTVMVNGQFRCLGSPQYLKNKYGKGYTLLLSCTDSTLQTVKSSVENSLPGAILAEEKLNHLSYQLPKKLIQLDQVFNTIELIKNDLKDFSVTQTTLEEVSCFIDKYLS
uniref:ABC transporter domain-containing protein n=2 Tax=Clastoptera arizonana TaxID=38151 RepID=A0A1B6D889_9HEMI